MPPAFPGFHSPQRHARGFTFIEILTVVAILGILASLLFPLIGRVQQNAKKAKTRVQFSQWGAAIEAFRQEYGFYPNFSAISSNLIDTNNDTEVFVQTLSGRRVDGTLIASGTPGDPGYAAGNTKKIGFYSFGEGDLSKEVPPRLQDGFGNTEIVVLLDRDYDGMVRVGTPGDYASAPSVNGLTPSFAAPIRAGVIFYSAGAGNSSEDIVASWK